LALFILSSFEGNAQPCSPIITTIAGDGSTTYSGDGGEATAAGMNPGNGVAVDKNGNVYISDYCCRIRKVNTSGIITTIAGTSSVGFGGDGGAATLASLNQPIGVACDTFGNIYIADRGNNRIRKVTPSGIITTFAGNGSSGFSGDGGQATAATFSNLTSVAVDLAGNVYTTDDNQVVQMINSSGIIQTIAGIGGSSGDSGDGGLATVALLTYPHYVAIDKAGNVYISDAGNSKIRVVNTSGIITTIAGNGTSGYSGDGGEATAAILNSPGGIGVDSNFNVYISDESNNRVREINASGIITTIAGNGSLGFSGDGGLATGAELTPHGLCLGEIGNLYFIDNHLRIRRFGILSLPVVASITGVSTICVGGMITLADSSSSGIWSASNSTIATIGSTGIVAGITAGIDTISYSITNSCGTATTTKTITVNPLPSISASSGVAICNGSSTTLAATGGITYSWSPSVGLSCSSCPSPIASPSVTTTYVVTGTDVNSCSNTATVMVTVNPLPGTVAAWQNTGSVGFSAGISEYTSIAIDGSGTPYVVYQDNSVGGNATVMKYNGSSWVLVGSAGFSAGIAYYTSIAIDGSGTPYVVYSDNANGQRATVMKYNGSSWITIGSAGFSAGQASYTSIAIDASGTPYVVYQNNGYSATVMKYNGSSWVTVGSAGFSAGQASFTTIAIDGSGTPYVSYEDNGNSDKATVMKFNGSSWVTVGGAGFSAGIEVYNSIAIDGSGTPYVAYEDGGYSGPATVMKYNGSSWVTVGSAGFSAGQAQYTSIAIDGSGTPYVAYEDYANSQKTTVMQYNGSSWVITGSAGFSAGPAFEQSIAIDGSGKPYVVYSDEYSGFKASAMELNTMILPISGVAAICAGSTTILSDATAGGLWSSGNSYTATIDAGTGIITGAAITAVAAVSITYTLPTGCTATAFETVNPLPSAITGTETVCIASITDLSDAVPGGTWASSNTDIANVVAEAGVGAVTGVAIGTAAISYTTSCGTVTTIVTVNTIPSVGTITGPSSVQTGSYIILSDGTAGGTWSSSNTSIATVFSTLGTVTGVALGSAIITYTVSNSCGTATATTTISVVPSDCQKFISTYAGTGVYDYTGYGGPATAASFKSPYGLAVDANNNVYIADQGNHRIEKIDAVTGIITSIAGTGTEGYSGDGGQATAAELSEPSAVMIDNSNNIYITEFVNNVVRKITPSGTITTFAGNGVAGYSGDGGPATDAQMYQPAGITFDGFGNIYIEGSGVVRKVSPEGIITTYVGGGSDVGEGVPATNAYLNNPTGITMDGSGNLYISDTWGSRIRKVNSSGVINTIGGNGVSGYSGDGGPATDAQIGFPYGITVDGSGSVYFTDYINWDIRKIDNAGIISTVAGNGIEGFSGDGGVPTAAEFDLPLSVALDGLGNLFIADVGNNRIRKIGIPGIAGTTAICLGATTSLSNPDNGGAWSSSNTGIAAVDGSGNVTGVAVGTATITYTLPCGYVVASVTVNPLPTPITGPTTVCAGSIITLSEGNTGGLWSSSNTGVAAVDGSGNVTGLSPGTTNITYALSCGTVTTIITVNPTPDVSPSANQNVCNGSIIAPISFTGSVPGTVFSWTNTNTAIGLPAFGIGDIASFIATNSSAMPISSVITVSSAANGCAGSSNSFTIAINPTPLLSSPLTPTGICSGTVFSYLPTTATTGTVFSWSRALITGISNPAASGTGNISETLVNTTSSPIAVTYVYLLTVNGCVNTQNVTVTVNPPTNAGTISGAATVNVGSTITLTDAVTGGTWSVSNTDAIVSSGAVGVVGVVTGVTSGIDTVKYTVSNTCGTAVAKRAVTVNATSSAITGTKTVCVGSTAILSDALAGGAWSSSNTRIAAVGASTGVLRGVSAGIVTITYTVSGSHITTTVTVNPDPSISVTSGTILCFGGTTVVTVGGVCEAGGLTGIGTFTVSAGAHSYTVTDTKGCSATASVTVSQPSGISVSGTVTNVSCYGGDNGSITTSVSGGTGPYTYHWSTGAATANITGKAAGTYSLTVTDHNGCTKTVSFTITQPPALSIAAVITNASCYGGSDGSINTTVSSGTPAYGYVWSNGCHVADPTGLCAGTYSVTVTDDHRCTVSGCYNVTQPSKSKGRGGDRMSGGATGDKTDETIQVYPNPNQGTFTMNLQSEYQDQVQVIISDIAGQRVKEFITSTNTNTDIIMDKAPGIYFLSAISPHGNYTVKLVIAQ